MIEMTGIGTYIKNLCKNSNIHDLMLGDKRVLEKYFPERQTLEFNQSIYGIKEQICFPYRKLKTLSPEILHIPHYNIPLLYKENIVTTIHDIIHILFPEYLPNKRAFYYAKFMLNSALSQSKHVITVSHNTKKDLMDHFNVDPNKITVVYNGVDQAYRKKETEQYKYLYEKYSIPKDRKIVLYVGNKKPHKNLERLLYAYDLCESKKESILLFVGSGFSDYRKLEEVAKKLCIIQSIVHTGIVSESELIDLYNMADLLIFPSLYEGFGLPPLEAMACGTPVVCSNCSSIPEIVGDAAYKINPYDIKDLSVGIDKVLNDNVLRNELIERGFERSAAFTWEKCASKTMEVYEKVMQDQHKEGD